VRLWTSYDGTWKFNDHTYTATTLSGVKAAMLSPAANSGLTTSATFTWDSGLLAGEYWVQAGPKPGSADYYNKSAGKQLSTTLAGLPANGGLVHVRLWTLLDTKWVSNDYTYSSFEPAKGVLASPLPNSTLPATSATLSWTPGAAGSQYWLYVGTTKGGYDLLNKSTGSDLSAAASSMPSNGAPVYVRLWTLFPGSIWVFSDYTYTGFTAAQPVLVSPQPGSTLTSDNTTFTWSGGSAGSEYWLYLGTSTGGFDLYNKSTGTGGSATVAALPTLGVPLHVRLWSRYPGGSWVFTDYTYTSATTAGEVSQLQSIAAAGTALTFNWSAGANITQYWLELGTAPGKTDLYTKSQGMALSGTVANAPPVATYPVVYARMWSLIGGKWYVVDKTFTR
jgi:hypothetical protein